jgi:PilZ domain
MYATKRRKDWSRLRSGSRVRSLQEIWLNYEGHSEEVVVPPPDVSSQGMFISTSRKFPEGSVLKLRFRLALTGAEIRTRCEVRYCLIGVEFVGISPEAVGKINREINLCEPKPSRKRSAEGEIGEVAHFYPQARQNSESRIPAAYPTPAVRVRLI